MVSCTAPAKLTLKENDSCVSVPVDSLQNRCHFPARRGGTVFCQHYGRGHFGLCWPQSDAALDLPAGILGLGRPEHDPRSVHCGAGLVGDLPVQASESVMRPRKLCNYFSVSPEYMVLALFLAFQAAQNACPFNVKGLRSLLVCCFEAPNLLL